MVIRWYMTHSAFKIQRPKTHRSYHIMWTITWWNVIEITNYKYNDKIFIEWRKKALAISMIPSDKHKFIPNHWQSMKLLQIYSTYRSLVAHICVSGCVHHWFRWRLATCLRQAITYIRANISQLSPTETKFSDIWNKNKTTPSLSFEKIIQKCFSFC